MVKIYCLYVIEMEILNEIKVNESDTARVEDMVKEYFHKADDVCTFLYIISLHVSLLSYYSYTT